MIDNNKKKSYFGSVVLTAKGLSFGFKTGGDEAGPKFLMSNLLTSGVAFPCQLGFTYSYRPCEIKWRKYTVLNSVGVMNYKKNNNGFSFGFGYYSMRQTLAPS